MYDFFIIAVLEQEAYYVNNFDFATDDENCYQLIDLDNGDKIITAAKAVKGVKGTWVSDGN